jgi:hypothetical protein
MRTQKIFNHVLRRAIWEERRLTNHDAPRRRIGTHSERSVVARGIINMPRMFCAH